MPRNVRNFWATIETSDNTRAQPVETGPRSADGELSIRLLVRHEGCIHDRDVRISCFVERDTGDLVVSAIDTSGDVHELSRTQRDAPKVPKPPRVFKTHVVKVIQSRYKGNRWEDVCEYEGNTAESDCAADLAEYQFSAHESMSYRAISRRVPNPAYKG